ncbi:uncharacterized protein LOC100198801 isoform X1 [Hydra vulgaris]|uniref:Uncharacterized protein LOC100198801 isoform X1 n=2 Tax=Hydra vulgaris TaxID=6087 RepID=A0ABM4D3W4_HYDVU
MSVEEVIHFLVVFLISKSSQENVQWSEWSRLSACSVTCGNGFRYQYRECNVVNPNLNTSFCQGHSEMKVPCVLLACPKAERCNCGCILNEARGRIISTLSYEKSVDCYWRIETGFETRIKITIFDLKLTHGYLLLNGNKNFNQKYIIPKERQNNLPVTVTSFGNRVNISLHNYLEVPNDEIRFQAEYEEITEPSHENTSSLNIPAIAGITCCVAIILIASCIIGYKKYIRSSDIKENNLNKDEEIDQRSSTSSSNRSSRQKSETPTLNKSRMSNKNALLMSIEQQKLLECSQRGYPEGGEHYLQQPNYIVQPCWAQVQVNGKENYVLHSPNGSNYVMIPGHFNGPQKV